MEGHLQGIRAAAHSAEASGGFLDTPARPAEETPGWNLRDLYKSSESLAADFDRAAKAAADFREDLCRQAGNARPRKPRRAREGARSV